MVWKNSRKSEERKQKVLCEATYLSLLRTVCSVSLTCYLLSYGVTVFSVFQTSPPHYNSTQIQEHGKVKKVTPADPPFLLGVKFSCRNHKILSLSVDHMPTFKSIGNTMGMIKVGMNQSIMVSLQEMGRGPPFLNLWLPTLTKSRRKNKTEEQLFNSNHQYLLQMITSAGDLTKRRYTFGGELRFYSKACDRGTNTVQ